MKIINVTPEMTVLPLGRLGENETTQFVFDVSDWLEEYPGGTIGLAHRLPHTKNDYACTITSEGDGKYSWTITSAELTTEGCGKCELILIKDSKVKKGKVYKTLIGEALDPDQDPPSVWQGYVTDVLHKKEDAEAYAVGKRSGTDVGETDPTYHNNAKYYSEQASGSASAAAGSATTAGGKAQDAEAYAIGKRGGTDVESTDPAYHNNSKYYAENCESLIEAATTTATTNATAAVLAAAESIVDGYSKTSEAYAVGKRGGTDVGSSDPAYHNNSKYYSEQAATSATAAHTAQLAAEAAAAEEVSDWLAAHVDPETGYVIDNTLTVTGAAADAKKVGDEIGDLKSQIDLETRSFAISSSASFTTDVKFTSGDVVVIDISSVSGKFSVWTVDHTSDIYAAIETIGRYTITTTSDGALRFYMNTSGTIVGSIYMGSRLSDMEVDLAENDDKTNGAINKLFVINDELYNQTIITSTKTTGYRLNGYDGKYHTDANYDTRVFSVTAGDLLEIESLDQFQFQTENKVNTYSYRRVGKTYGEGKYYLTVPQTASYLCMSYPASGNDPTVKKSAGLTVPKISDVQSLYDALKYYQITYYVPASTSHGTSDDQLAVTIPAGTKFRVEISASGTVSTLNLKAFYSDNTDEFIQNTISVPGILSFTASKNIKAFGFWSGSSFSSNNVYVTVKVYEDGTVLDVDLNPVPALSAYQIKTLKVFDSFTLNNGTYSFSAGANINNYRNYASSSSVAYNTPPIKIKNKDGSLIYKNLHLNSSKTTSTVDAVWTFDINGNYLRKLNFSEELARQTPFASDEYYAILNAYPNSTGYENSHWYVENIEIEWLNNQNKSVYTVGTDGDFATFTAMLIALADDDSEKTVYVKGGVYDIFEEMGGADYIASISSSASELNWRDVCHVVPPNTTIKGVGNVVLKWEPTAQQMVNSATAFLFSPLNISGTCRIENITVSAKNCRYTVHDETSGLSEYDGAKHVYKNCRFTLLSGTYGGCLYGAGHNKKMELLFEDCVFDSQNADMIWSTHDHTTPANENSVFTFNNCIFTSTINNAFVRFSSADSYGRLDKVMFNNCYLKKIKFVASDNTNRKQGYDVQLIGCSPVEVEYADYVTDRVAVRQYNPIPQST